MNSRIRTRTTARLLAIALAAALGTAPASAAPIDEATPRFENRPWPSLEPLWRTALRWLSPFGVTTAADGEDPPPDPEPDPDPDDPFDGSEEPDPGSGGGVLDPNG